MSAIKLFRMLCVGLIVTTSLAIPRAMSQPSEPGKSQQALIDEKLNKVASLLAVPLGEEVDFRLFVWMEMETSRSREQMLDLEETVKNAPKSDTSPASMGSWGALNDAITELKNAVAGPGPAAPGAPPVSFKLYFPVAEHRQQWDGGTNLLVASSPSADETSVTSITAYSAKDGSVVMLDPNAPPATPTIFVANDDLKSSALTFPLVTISSDVAELAPVIPGPNDLNSFIGVPYVEIWDDHEPWYKGSPEIYMKVTQWHGGADVSHTVDLPGVNDEFVRYYLGDGPASPTYFFFNTDYDRITLYEFWEADSPDGDDFLGSCRVNRDPPWWNYYRRYRAGDAIFWVDLDP